MKFDRRLDNSAVGACQIPFRSGTSQTTANTNHTAMILTIRRLMDIETAYWKLSISISPHIHVPWNEYVSVNTQPPDPSYALHWRNTDRDGVSNHRRLDCLLNRLYGRRSKKTSTLRVTGLCEGNPSVTDVLPSPSASNAKNVSLWRRHHGCALYSIPLFAHMVISYLL